MSEEEEENNEENEGEENEDDENDNEENEGEENEDDENDNEDNEGEENEDDENDNEEGEEKEDNEEEEEDEEEKEDKKKKKGKKEKKKDNKKEEKKKEKEEQQPPQSSKFSEDKLLPSKEIKMDLNLNSSNTNNIYFNGNDITLANITPPKKSTLQLLAEISTEMDSLSSHLEEVLAPIRFKTEYSIQINTNNFNNISPQVNLDNQDLEIKKLIEKANDLTNNSILNKKVEENGNNKTYEDKCCQSDDEIENSYYQQLEENKSRDEINNYNNYNTRRFPYDPYKYIDYYNELKNNNNNLYRRRPLIYSQNENNNNYRGNDIPFERYKQGSISQAMDILLDKK